MKICHRRHLSPTTFVFCLPPSWESLAAGGARTIIRRRRRKRRRHETSRSREGGTKSHTCGKDRRETIVPLFDACSRPSIEICVNLHFCPHSRISHI